MIDEMDDFGDLYADLDDHPSFPAFHNHPTGDAAKIDSKLAEIEPAVDELGPQLRSSVAAVEEEEETPMAEDQSSSDSEDDLRIVLNERDCLELPFSRRVDLQSDEEDEGDDLVIVADQPTTDRRWTPDDDGLARVELGKGAESKRRCRYVGFNSVLYPRNAKASTSGGWEWDRVQMLWPEGTAFCNIAIPTAEQNGFGFSIPRNRTIFDVNIEAFERKPWQQQGVDLTDFFNFGLDEEGWRSYWQSLNHYRQQAAISMGLHNCEPSRLNQGEVSSSALENVEKRGRGFDMPMGRAIQVEDGEGERLPSIDIRRTRYRDSDVVIQITMEDSMDDASLSTKKEQGRRNGFLHKSSNKIDCLLPLDCNQGFKDKARPVESHHSEVNEIVSKVIKEEGKAIYKRSGELIPSRIDGPDIKAESTSGDHFLHHSNSSDSEQHSEASNNAITLEKDPNSVDDVSTISGIQLKESEKSDNYIPNNSRCDAIDRDEEDDPEFIDRPLRNHQSCRTRIRCLEVQNVPLDDKHIYSQDKKDRRNESDHMEASCGTRHRGYKYDFDVGGRSSSYREMCKSVSYSSRRYAKKQASGHSNFRSSCRYDYQSTNLKSGSSESVSLLRQRDSVGDDEIEKREHYFNTRNNGVWAMRDSTSEDLKPVTSEHQLPSREKDIRCWHINKSEDCCRRVEAVYDERLTENRCRERFLQGIHESHISYRSEEEEIFDYKFSRLVPYGSRELRNIEGGSFLDLDRPTRYANKDSRNQKHLNRKSLVSHTCRETNITCEGRRRVASPSKNDLQVPWRTSKTYVDHRELPNTEKIPSKKNKDVYFVPGIKDRHHLYNRNYLDVKDDNRVAGERVVHNESSASSERRKYNRLAKPRLHIDDEVSLSHHKKWSDMPHPKLCSSLERNSRHNSLVNHDVGGHKFFDYEYDIKVKEAEESAKFHLRARTSSVSDSFGNVVHELASVRCREAVTLHVNGWKGKLPRRCSKVTVDSNSHRNKESARDDLLIGSRNIEDLCNRKEVSLCSLEMGVNHNSRSRLNKDKVKEAKSDHSNDHIRKNGHDTHPNAQKHEDDEELEEGELLEEPDYEEVIPERESSNVEKKVTYRGIESSGSNNVEENHFQSEDFARNDKIFEGYDNKHIEGYDNSHILQALAKMEKRKERFKKPIAPKDHKKSLNSQLNVAVVMDEAKQTRPSRKRRWGSS